MCPNWGMFGYCYCKGTARPAEQLLGLWNKSMYRGDGYEIGWSEDKCCKAKTLRVNVTFQELLNRNKLKMLVNSVIWVVLYPQVLQITHQTFGRLSIIWKSFILSLRSKISIFNSNIKSTLLYNCETSIASTCDMQNMPVLANRYLRRALCIFCPRIVSNLEKNRSTALSLK